MNIIGLTLYGVRGFKWGTLIIESCKTGAMISGDEIRLLLSAGYLAFIMYAVIETFFNVMCKKFNLPEN